MKHIFVINPVSGHGMANKLLPMIEDYFKDRPNDYTIHMTQYPGHATELASQYTSQDDVTVYSCGGDGTNHEILNGLNPGVTMAIIPSGSGNDFSRMFGMKEIDAKQWLIQTIEGKVCRCDCGEADGRRFLNCATLGFDADVASLASDMARTSKIPSKLIYLVAVFKILSKRHAIDATMEFNGQILKEQSLILALMNGRFYGGGFLPTPMADIQDGALDLCVVKNTSLPNILRLLPKYMKGTHINEPIVSFHKTDSIQITCSNEVNYEVDGEIGQTRSLNIRLIKGGLDLRVPKSSTLKELT